MLKCVRTTKNIGGETYFNIFRKISLNQDEYEAITYKHTSIHTVDIGKAVIDSFRHRVNK